MLSAWLRVVRVRFLLASVVAVSVGLAVAWRHQGALDILDAALTLAGVLALHASVDMLNDYWDYKRGIDTRTSRTKMSGGTGVLPEGLLEPAAVYRAGVASLVAGASVGAYLAISGGPAIAIILGFAVISVYFYSTKIANYGLGEAFVAIKGALIVVGTCLVQTDDIIPGSIYAGVAVGALSSLVLFVSSFPDHDADKSRGKRTLVVLAGKRRASRLFWAFPAISYVALASGVLLGVLPPLSLAALAAAPLAALAGAGLCRDHSADVLPHMLRTLLYSRVSGAAVAAGIAADSLL